MNILHLIALESEDLFQIDGGIFVTINPVFGILFRNSTGFVYNKALTLQGGF